MKENIVAFINRYLSPGSATALSQAGTTIFNDTVARTGNWWKFTVVGTTAAVFTTLVDAERDGTAIGALSFPLGVTIEGQFTEITLASGAIYASKYDTKRWWQR